MAANKQQGSYFGLFLVGATVLCTGFAYYDSGTGQGTAGAWSHRHYWKFARLYGDQAARGNDADETRRRRE